MLDRLPPVEAPFGVVVATSAEHLHLAQGTCASIRHFMPDVPICVLVDSSVPALDLRRYGVRILRRRHVRHPQLRRLTFRSQLSKLNLLWYAPFERFFYLDADAVVWGDLRALVPDLEDWDFVLHTQDGDPSASREVVMDTEAAARHFPDFDAVAHEPDYVNSGIWFARRDALEARELLDLLRFDREHPGILKAADQGMLNFLIFRAADQGRVRVTHRRIMQWGSAPKSLLLEEFAIVEGRPRVLEQPLVLHWAGTAEPRVDEPEDEYFEPMTFFRREFQRQVRGSVDDARLRRQDSRLGGRPPRVRIDRDWLRYQPRRARVALALRLRRR